jgi:murein DD-endopeptidase MepM/ murein hydrolase activator NlpD
MAALAARVTALALGVSMGAGLAASTLFAALQGPVAAEQAPGESGGAEPVPPAPAAAPSAQPAPVPAASAPLRPQPQQLPPSRPTTRFDDSLDALVRDGVVSPVERSRIRNPAGLQPLNAPAHQQACRSGALSAQECRSGVVLRWRGRLESAPVQESGSGTDGPMPFERLGADGRPLPPLTVPVSALLAGGGGTFRLEDVFRVTPRPAPIVGNGNRRLLFPVIGSAVNSSSFGFRLHPILGIWRLHAGQDLAAPEGTPVVAALSGQVVSSGLAGGYGLAIEIEHANPRRRTLYGHLSELYVKAGDRVRQGEVIGRVGSTGLSTGPHLHFELRLPQAGGWVAVDPGDLDPGSGATGTDAIALLMGQLLGSLERPVVPPVSPVRSRG